MSVYLADSNLLIALVVSEHIHHPVALEWFATDEPGLATCPITQGALLRFLIREGQSSSDAGQILDTIIAQPWHMFLADSLQYDSDLIGSVLGHRQVTDAYLAALARHHDIRIATLDKGLASLHSDVAHLLAPAP